MVIRCVVVLIVLLMAAVLPLVLHPSDAGPEPLPLDPLQRCSAKALRGDFGELKPWQREGYLRARRLGIPVQGYAWVTAYYPQEGFPAGQATRSGVGVSRRSAACARWRWSTWSHCYVWTQAYGLRVIEDTGADKNERVARRKGADVWFDYWFPYPVYFNPITYYAVF